MPIDSYHHLSRFAVPEGVIDGEWLSGCLARARATLLHRLEFTSARLQLRGLRLHVNAPPQPPVPLHPYREFAVALTIIAVDKQLQLREALYGDASQGAWQRYRWSHSHIGVSRGGAPEALPADLRADATAWLRLFRGCIEYIALPESLAGTSNHDSHY